MDQVLEKMGFDRTWRGWIWSCLSSVEMSIIINGSPSKPFKMERGLRQEDPLSPFLFVLVADVLNKILNRAIQNGLVEGMKSAYHIFNLRTTPYFCCS